MKDFLRGALGTLLQWVLAFLSAMFFMGGLVSCMCASLNNTTSVGGVFIFLGVLCLCAIAGIRYWLGHIVRMR